jgi:acyl-CoA reductase-like NAD-dependent aldehyde dehydrogenase
MNQVRWCEHISAKKNARKGFSEWQKTGLAERKEAIKAANDALKEAIKAATEARKAAVAACKSANTTPTTTAQ